jgi:hypothetical protein
VLSAVKQFEKTGKKSRLFFAATLPTEPWGHWAGLKICCDFAQIVRVSGFDHIGFGAE